LGYIQEEFFFSGTATSYKASGELPNDGRWTAEPAESAPYTSRLIVIRPSDPKKFNGTAVVEWLNVTAGGDLAPDWIYLHRELIRDGFAYVGVSAQKVGVEGGASFAQGAAPLKKANPERYAKLTHPGDAYSYDIFSEGGRAVPKVLGPLVPKHLLGIGESQSAVFLTTYVNAVDPLAKVFDGFQIHSRFAYSALLSGAMFGSGAPPANPAGVQIRADMRVPVMTFESETDVLGPTTMFYRARQADTNRFRLWEVTGTAHADSYTVGGGAVDSGTLPIDKLAEALKPGNGALGLQLGVPMNSALQHHYVEEAALFHLNQWVAAGKAPPKAPRMETVAGDQPTFALDANGNVLGGIRSPWMDTPTAKLSGAGQTGPGLAFLFGSTQVFDKATLDKLYPGGKSEYLAKFDKSLNAAVKAGFILKVDAPEIKALAAALYPGS
jgi:hypothetical protein